MRIYFKNRLLFWFTALIWNDVDLSIQFSLKAHWGPTFLGIRFFWPLYQLPSRFYCSNTIKAPVTRPPSWVFIEGAKRCQRTVVWRHNVKQRRIDKVEHTRITQIYLRKWPRAVVSMLNHLMHLVKTILRSFSMLEVHNFHIIWKWRL